MSANTAARPAEAVKYKLVYYAPLEDVESVNSAIFQAGAGRYPGSGGYTECAWVSAAGTGQFRPGDAANPHASLDSVLKLWPGAHVLIDSSDRQGGRAGKGG